MTATTPNHFYVYVHKRNDTGAVFYVGKGMGQRAHEVRNRSEWWKRIVAKAGGFTVQLVAENYPEDQAFELERLFIASYGRENLCNMTDGGDGASGRAMSEEGVEQARARALEMWSSYTPEERAQHAANLSAAWTEDRRAGVGLRNKALPAEERQRRARHAALVQSAALSPEQRRQRGLDSNAKQTPEERRARQAKAHANMTPEARVARAVKAAETKAALPDEVKAARNAENSARYQGLTDEQKRAREAKRVAALMARTPEEKALTAQRKRDTHAANAARKKLQPV